jgi:hypothetical protein
MRNAADGGDHGCEKIASVVDVAQVNGVKVPLRLTDHGKEVSEFARGHSSDGEVAALLKDIDEGASSGSGGAGRAGRAERFVTLGDDLLEVAAYRQGASIGLVHSGPVPSDRGRDAHEAAHVSPPAGRARSPRVLTEVVALARAMRARSAPSSVSL